MKRIGKLLAANRSEIAIRVFRSTHELGIRTVAIYSHEDRYALHRFKADESYLVGRPGEPIQAYLDAPAIMALARHYEVDAIHPGYGFLAENPDFAQACHDAGIVFVGPKVETLKQLGDKLAARRIAERAGVPVLGGSGSVIRNTAQAKKLADKIGFPVILKAAHGGGGRGMRVVRDPGQFEDALEQARRESLTAFGSPDIFVEKFIERARHIEVQLLGDAHGNLVHLFERDCSVQRRHQKVVEIAPAPNLDPAVRQALCEAAVAIGRAVHYENAGTVEFLLDADTGRFYFIEVNPRIQVEHTVTEEVTGIDIVKSQILIAQGVPLDDPAVGLLPAQAAGRSPAFSKSRAAGADATGSDAPCSTPATSSSRGAEGAGSLLQEAIGTNGYAIQCRVTTEDPSNNFMPDYGRISHYRSASGMGIRLDAGTAFSGAVVYPFYDSLLVKVTAWAQRFADVPRRMERCLQEFRVRGVKTNIPFLIKLIMHPTFMAGGCTTRFIDLAPELFDFPPRRDRATKLLTYLAETIVNGNPLVKDRPKATRRAPAPVPGEASRNTQPAQTEASRRRQPAGFHANRKHQPTGKYPEADASGSPRIPREADACGYPDGMRQRLKRLGPEKFAEWVRKHKPLLMTDTTFRDAHQSLLATRFRTYDLLQVAEAYALLCPELFSIEMWGGATFDSAMRFLKECPWRRLAELRERIPNILFQMLLRASNAVGYTNYPDNVVKAFVAEAADAGIDLFRIFDALNWMPNMRVAMDAVLKSGAICEAAICYTGDILDPRRTKYDLKYYVEMAKELERRGAHILAIKDMAGLCKPYAAERLVKTLKQEVGLPIHFHTHDTAGVQAASIIKAADVGLDAADGAMAPMSGGTSQPNLNTLVEALHFTGRDTGLPVDSLDAIAEYWRAVREFYTPFETPVLPAGADLYRHEMPGGQYTNLFHQAQALGLADRWADVCRVYAEVNQMLGDIVKVTPTSKAVGDLALFLIANDMAPQDVLDSARELAFPQSAIDLVSGRMGQAPGGFPRKVRERILQGEKALRGRPGATLPPADFNEAKKTVQQLLTKGQGRSPAIAKSRAAGSNAPSSPPASPAAGGHSVGTPATASSRGTPGGSEGEPSKRDVLSYLLYPQVFADFAAHRQRYFDTSVLPTPAFLYGLEPGEEIGVEIERGKTLIIKFLAAGEPHQDGRRTVFFELNGQPREVTVLDRALEPETPRRKQADPSNPAHIASDMPGMVVTVAVQPGHAVVKGQKLVMLEAMKMQTTVGAPRDGRIAEVHVQPGKQVETGDLLMTMDG